MCENCYFHSRFFVCELKSFSYYFLYYIVVVVVVVVSQSLFVECILFYTRIYTYSMKTFAAAVVSQSRVVKRMKKREFTCTTHTQFKHVSISPSTLY